MEFDWDDRKAAANIRKHRITFEEAKTVFSDPKMKLRFDEEYSVDEDRYVALGISEKGRLLLVSFVTGEPAIGVPFERTRIISARKANRSEETDYG